MTRRRTYILTAIAVGIFLLLNWAFADGLFNLNNLWESDAITDSTIFTYLFIVLIAAAGAYQARSLPEGGAEIDVAPTTGEHQIDDPVTWKLLIGNAYLAIIWLPLRFFVGREWLSAGEHKVRSDAWMDGGTALQGYWNRVVTVPEVGQPSITYGWYRETIQYMLDNSWFTWFAKIVAIGEVLVGAALIIGALVGIAAFVGTFMNFSFMLAGSASSNPVLFGLTVLMVLGWKVAGYWGVDRWLLPLLGTPWQLGRLAQTSDGRVSESPV